MATLKELLQQQRLTAKYRQPVGMSAGMPDYGYGNRYQESQVQDPLRPKGLGYFGEVSRPDGGYSTEIGIGTDAYGEIPTMVPNLSENQLANLMTMGEEDRVPDDIAKKAISHAAWRKLQGQSPWSGVNDKQTLLPRRNGSLISDYWNR
jgi:hypothetical protein